MGLFNIPDRQYCKTREKSELSRTEIPSRKYTFFRKTDWNFN